MDNRQRLRDNLDAVRTLALNAETQGAQGSVDLALGDLVDLIDAARRAQRVAVDALRDDGLTWLQIAVILGVSRQSAHEQYGR